MKTSISLLSEEHLQEVDDLGRRYRTTIGFLTAETLREYLQKERVLGARADDGELAGYLLFADYPDRFRIAQLCVDDAYRGQGMARALLEALKSRTTTQKAIKLRCRRDFPAHHMWAKLGFIPLDEKSGRSAQGHPLTLWVYHLASDDELGLWKTEVCENILDVAVDAQIFYDFDDEEDTRNALISKALLNDFLVDSLNLWITDELFIEIDRKQDDTLRQQTLRRAQLFPRLTHHRDLAEQFGQRLETILPSRRPSEVSDIQHLAKTAASEVKTFATKDDRLLRRAAEIRAITGIRVIHPVELVSTLHKLTEAQSYDPMRVCGIGLRWRRMRAEDLSELPNWRFRLQGERLGPFLEKVRYFLSMPRRYRPELLISGDKPVALRVIDDTPSERYTVAFARISAADDADIYRTFLVTDALSSAVEDEKIAVEFESEEEHSSLEPTLRSTGFRHIGDRWKRPTLARCCSRITALKHISSIDTELGGFYKDLPNLDIEKACAPLVLDEVTPTFIVPIQPGYALGLIDRMQAADDLFGADPTVLLRWENVYYRKKSRHKMLQAPARVLWYASGRLGAIIGISHLDEVDVGGSKDLFRTYQRFGVLQWRDLFKMCDGNVQKEIMALRFSRTFMFKRQICLSTMEEVFAAHGVKSSFPSPFQIPFSILQELYRYGFPQNDEE